MIRGLGIDLVDVARLGRAIAAHGDRFLTRVFTADELAHADRIRGDARAIHLAGRFAAKEAAMKALGTGLGGGVRFVDFEVRTDDGTGAPTLLLRAAAARHAALRGAARSHLSISHIGTHATAVVVLEGDDDAHLPKG